MSQSTKLEECWRPWAKRWKWEMGTERGKKKRSLLHLKVRRLDSPLRTHTINKDDSNTIFENSIQFFIPPVILFSDITMEQKPSTPIWLKNYGGTDLNEGSGTTDITLRFKVEIWRHHETITETVISLCEGWTTHSTFLDVNTNCVTITRTPYWSWACILTGP